jgi:hypothetical protein
VPKVGIFFFVNSAILLDQVPVERGEPYGNAVQYGGHYEFWERLRPKNPIERKFKTRAYDAFPRGRVVYFPDKDKYVIYYDMCLGLNMELKSVIEKFELEGLDIAVAKDEHYKCAKCNPYFLD